MLAGLRHRPLVRAGEHGAGVEEDTLLLDPGDHGGSCSRNRRSRSTAVPRAGVMTTRLVASRSPGREPPPTADSPGATSTSRPSSDNRLCQAPARLPADSVGPPVMPHTAAPSTDWVR